MADDVQFIQTPVFGKDGGDFGQRVAALTKEPDFSLQAQAFEQLLCLWQLRADQNQARRRRC